MKFSFLFLVLSAPAASAFTPCTFLKNSWVLLVAILLAEHVGYLLVPWHLSTLSLLTHTCRSLFLCRISPSLANQNNCWVLGAATRTALRASTTSSSSQLYAERPRVVVTGMGITSCLGNTLEDVTKSLHEAKSGITKADEFERLGIKSQVFGRPSLEDEDFQALIPKSVLRFCGTNAKYAYIAMDRAIQHSGLKPEEYQENPRVASIIGQGGTSIPDIVETVEAVEAGGKRWKNKVGPFRVTRSMGSTCSAVLATAFKTQGPSYSISSACSTGAHCIGTGFEQIQLGKADIAFCGAGTFS